MKGGRHVAQATAVQRDRIVMVKELGCICCQMNRADGRPTAFFGVAEAHHLLSGGRRRGHEFTIGLCQWHHRGVPPFESARASDMVRTFGPSVATGSRAFHERYGTDDELLEYQEQLLAGARAVMREAAV